MGGRTFFLEAMTVSAGLALAASSCAALAQGDPRGAPGEPGYAVPKSSSSAPRPMEPGRYFRGEVKAVDKASGTITLRHGPITSLGVPATTADYAVKDSALLERVKVGDEVRFVAVLQGRSLLVTNIEPAN
jgi:Cu(I)/Ag(I) efflux system periplasmic protein CusF